MKDAQAYQEFLDAAVKLLRTEGWEPLVIGGAGVRQVDAFVQKHKYELCIGFTGGKPMPAPQEPTDEPKPA